MGEKMSKSMIADLVAKGATVGPSAADAIAAFEAGFQTAAAEAIAKYVPKKSPQVTTSDQKDHNLTQPSTTFGVWTFRIPNWAPTPLNKILYGKHWSDGARRKRSDGEVVAHYGRSVPKAKQKRTVSLHVVFPKGKRMPDVDAYAKSLLDSLVHCDLLVNDSGPWCLLYPVTYSRGEVLTTFITIEDV